MVNICPVCGFLMRYPARDWNICPSCGTEFGYDDAGRTHQQLRGIWISRGMPWWSPVEAPPIGWSAMEQLKRVLLNSASYTSPAPIYWAAFEAMGANTSTSPWEPTRRGPRREEGRYTEGRFLGSVPSANGTIRV